MTKKPPNYERFSIGYRVEHILLVLSFTTLAITGLVQKFNSAGFSEWFMATMGGIENVRIVHRVAAAILLFESVYHLVLVAYRVLVLRSRLSMLPGIKDAQAALDALLYNVGLRKDRPLEGRYNFAEKAEYWALVWGTVVMAITGFMLWNPIATAKILPGEVIPAAKAAHGSEAILAALAIIIWHFYHVHVRYFNKSIFTGKMTEKEMAHEHPLELAEIKAGTAQRPVTLAQITRRRWVFIPTALILGGAAVVGLFLFMTFEETAIVTVPPIENVEAFVPLTPTPLPTPLPTPTPQPVTVLTWEGKIRILVEEQCGACHNSASPLGGLDASSYETLLAGGDNGPGVVPGDANASLMISRQVTGDHPGQLSGTDLALLRQWIEEGAPTE